ncbi:MAG: NAD-dependent epimerase/dehydratase family protein [Ostreibacterium sp.]
MNKTVLITGSTGMVGSLVLKNLLENSAIDTIISIGRRRTGIEHKKLQEIVHTDFLDFSNLSAKLTNLDACFYCLGVYQNQVSKVHFLEITCDYQKALTDILQQSSPQLTFALFSASGADPTEKSRTLFAKGKGKAENLLNTTIFPEKYIFRPGYIHPTGNKKPSGLMYKMLLPVAAGLFKLFPSIGITDRDLAHIMVTLSLAAEHPSQVFSNLYMKQLIKTLF